MPFLITLIKHVERDSEDPSNFPDLKLPGFQSLSFLRINPNCLILITFFQNRDLSGIIRATIELFPRLPNIPVLLISNFIRSNDDPSRDRSIRKKPRTISFQCHRESKSIP